MCTEEKELETGGDICFDQKWHPYGALRNNFGGKQNIEDIVCGNC
jgi:hypothetical protein